MNQLTWYLVYTTMDKLPTTHTLTKEETAFVKSLDEKHQELHKLAVELLQTSYKPEWSYMWEEKAKAKK
jgi:hypothetical protein